MPVGCPPLELKCERMNRDGGAAAILLQNGGLVGDRCYVTANPTVGGSKAQIGIKEPGR